MAKTRQDFINEGRANAIKMQAPIGSVPEFANSGSWQAKAYLEGWNQGAKEYAADTLQMKTLRNQAQTCNFVKVYGVKQSPRETVKKHVSAILEQAYAENDDNRRSRILRKVVKLRAKWDL